MTNLSRGKITDFFVLLAIDYYHGTSENPPYLSGLEHHCGRLQPRTPLSQLRVVNLEKLPISPYTEAIGHTS